MNPAATPQGVAARGPQQPARMSAFLRERWAWLPLAALLAVAPAPRPLAPRARPAPPPADELDDLQNAYRVLAGTADGFFGLDWNQAPNLNVYLKAASVEVFGDAVAGARMYGVVLSLATLALFYPLAPRRPGPRPRAPPPP